jgi:quercetin dioxygenase-like cupin family protein
MITLAVLPVLWVYSATKHAKGEQITLTPEDLKWDNAPDALPAGAKMAVLEGDPNAKGGLYSLRLRLQADYKIPPHTHPTEERVTVLDGAVVVGMGEKFDESSAKQLGKESYFVMPAEHAHFLGVKQDATLQITGKGPFAITYVNPTDDPRSKKTER